MKRFVCILFALCLCFSMGMAAMAAPYADISVLFEVWEEFGYPDDVGGVYSTDGSVDRLTVLLVGDEDGSREAEIRAMLNDDSEATFEASTYSYNRLLEIHQEVTGDYLFEDLEFHSCGIGWGQDGGFGESGHELRVVLTVDEARLEEYREMFSKVYGDAVVVEAGGPLELTTGDPTEPDAALTEESEAQSEGEASSISGLAVTLIIVSAVLIVGVGILFLLRMKKK